MPALKDKLNQKVKNIEGVTESASEPETTIEPENNLIILKPNQPDSFVPDFAITLNEARQRIAMLHEFVKEIMIANVDYGMIPGCNKPSLFKSGAEKLCDVYGLSKKIEVINRVEDWNAKVFHYEVKVSLINKRTGLMEAEGIGSCNSHERRYANQEAFSIINTLVKMAKKRALVDAVLSATRSSALFTQDVEDFEITTTTQPRSENPTSTAQDSSSNTVRVQDSSAQTEPAHKPASRSQLGLIVKLVGEKRIVMGEINSLLKNRYNVGESKLLSTQQADDFIKFLMAYKLKINEQQ